MYIYFSSKEINLIYLKNFIQLMKKGIIMFVIIALTQAILLSALATTLVSLAPAANAKIDCFSDPSGQPQGRACGNPHEFGGPPAPSCTASEHNNQEFPACRRTQ